jgi:hypothetical protein
MTKEEKLKYLREQRRKKFDEEIVIKQNINQKNKNIRIEPAV